MQDETEENNHTEAIELMDETVSEPVEMEPIVSKKAINKREKEAEGDGLTMTVDTPNNEEKASGRTVADNIMPMILSILVSLSHVGSSQRSTY